MSKKLFNIISLVLLVSMVLAACAPTEVIKTVVVEKKRKSSRLLKSSRLSKSKK